ncbi:DUF2293 domain-containing protein [Mycobacterium sp. IS-1556]|uniref:DUF2293 domain-containing protein n=1 Tax=Mycobacterium sp. IS-1556 TaxID=1772276 RepID=UPI002570D893|nr:DUF2293 domain-containing protein [Mycobacterium sp. IS-1556]
MALHTAVRFRDRVKRCIGAGEVDADAVGRAVEASVLHVDTEYDNLIESGVDRESARAQMDDHVEAILNAWRDGVALLDESLRGA